MIVRITAALALAAVACSPAGAQTRPSATGLVLCGGAVSTGQLTGTADTITTVAHALYDEAGRSRARFGPCVFRISVSGVAREFALRARSRQGSRLPYAHAGADDWAVARLVSPVPGGSPYRFGGRVRPGDRVFLASARPDGADRPALQSCRVLAIGSGRGAGREIRTDCDSRSGDSGAAYLTADGRLVAVHVGVRREPGFGPAHAFGVAAEGVFRGAAALR